MKLKLNAFFLCLSLAGLCSCTKTETAKEAKLYLDLTDEWRHRFYFNIEERQSSQLNYDYDISGDLVVDGSDIYYPAHKGYYKNGVLVQLPQANSIQCLFVKDGDVYAAGNREPWGVTYWKNGQMFKLDPDSTAYGMAPLQIVVNEQGIFIAGEYREGNLEEIAYWKNGVLNRLPNGPHDAQFTAMAISGSDVYIAGTSKEENGGVGVYWRNLEKRYLYNYDQTRPYFLSSIRAFNNSIYITGGSDGPLYWKNETPFGNSGFSNKPTDIFVDDDNVYVAGTFMLPYGSGPVYNVTLYKNGDFDTISTGISKKFAVGQ